MSGHGEVAILAIEGGKTPAGERFDIVQIEMPPRPPEKTPQIRLAERQRRQAKDVHHIEAGVTPRGRWAEPSVPLMPRRNHRRAPAEFSQGLGYARGDGRIERNHQQVHVVVIRQNFQHRAGSHGQAIAGQRWNYRADIEQAGVSRTSPSPVTNFQVWHSPATVSHVVGHHSQPFGLQFAASPRMRGLRRP